MKTRKVKVLIISVIVLCVVTLVTVLGYTHVVNYENSLEKEKTNLQYSCSFSEGYYDNINSSPPSFCINPKFYDKNGNFIDCLYYEGEPLYLNLEFPTVYSFENNGDFYININTVETIIKGRTIYDKSITTNIEVIKNENFVRTNGKVKNYITKNASVVSGVTTFESKTLSILESSDSYRRYNLKYSLLFISDVVNIYQTTVAFVCEDSSLIEKLDECCA